MKCSSELSRLASQLEANLNEQYQIYSECIELAAMQRRALCAHKYIQCNEVNVLQETKAALLEELELNRLELTRALMELVPELGKPSSVRSTGVKALASLSINDLLIHLEVSQAQGLKVCASRLKLKVIELKTIHEANARLIEASRQMNRHTIEILSRISQPGLPGETPIYGAQGILKKEKSQPRPLIQIKA